jgi:hypothetical protein
MRFLPVVLSSVTFGIFIGGLLCDQAGGLHTVNMVAWPVLVLSWVIGLRIYK